MEEVALLGVSVGFRDLFDFNLMSKNIFYSSPESPFCVLPYHYYEADKNVLMKNSQTFRKGRYFPEE